MILTPLPYFEVTYTVQGTLVCCVFICRGKLHEAHLLVIGDDDLWSALAFVSKAALVALEGKSIIFQYIENEAL